MGAALNFDATNVDPTSPIAPVPNGKYTVAIVASEVKDASTGNGKYLQLELQILEGDYKGRKLWDRLNIQNANATAQEIAQRQLSAICHATGVLKLSNSSQLHNIPVIAKIVVKPGDKGYDPKNEVKGYESVAGGPVAAEPKTVTAAATPAAQPSPNAPSWARKAS